MSPAAALTVPPAWSLAGRTALVTGAGSASGIGFAAARMLGELGAGVILTATTDRVMDDSDTRRTTESPA